MIRYLLIVVVISVVILGGLFGFKAMERIGTKQGIAAMGMPAQTVSTTKVGLQDWQPTVRAVGSFRAVNGADISAEAAGIVQAILFESGAEVEKGAVLAQLRADDDIAKLRALESTAKLAEITYARDLKQLKAQAISQAVADADAAALDSAKAQVMAQQALIDKKTIRAPFAGRLGIRQVDVGQYLTAGTALVTLQQLDPIYVDFSVPERDLTQITIGQKIMAVIDAHPDTPFEGQIMAINSKIDEATRNVQIRASFANAARTLMPGMFATLTIEVGQPTRILTLPQTVITYNPYGDNVYVVDASNPDKLAVRQQFVTTGARRGDQIAILSGLKEGDEVVTSGQLKLRNGMPIKINNEIQPTNDPNPKPQER